MSRKLRNIFSSRMSVTVIEPEPETPGVVLDWRNDSEVRTLRTRLEEIEQRLPDLKRALKLTQRDETNARGKLDELELFHLVGRATTEEVEQARALYHDVVQARKIAAAQLLAAEQDHERILDLLPAIEDVAQRLCAEKLCAEYRGAVVKLQGVLENAADCNNEVVRLWALGHEWFPQEFGSKKRLSVPRDAGLELLTFRPLVHNPNAVSGGLHGMWRKQIAKALAALADDKE